MASVMTTLAHRWAGGHRDLRLIATPAAGQNQEAIMSTEEWRGELGRRRHALLMAVINDFVKTAEPVGSHHIAARYALGVKAATVRNMMAEMEQEKYFYQPHTSAGRIPTEKAFRYYVDHLAPQQIGQQIRAQIEYHYSERSGDPSAIVRDTSRLLALLTGQAAIVVKPRFESIELRAVNFIAVRERQVLAVFVTMSGGVHHQLVDTRRIYLPDELERMAGYLNGIIEGRTLEEARAVIERTLRQERARYDLRREALTLGDTVVNRPVPVEVYVEGSNRVLHQPEFNDPDKIRAILDTLEDKAALLDLLERALKGHGVEVSIGSEHAPGLSGISVVGAPYLKGMIPLGSIAILGPVRMDYARVIGVVDYTARALSRVLDS
jgi:heat-inducible transcriptional repressor